MIYMITNIVPIDIYAIYTRAETQSGHAFEKININKVPAATPPPQYLVIQYW